MTPMTTSDPVTTREWDAYHQGVIDGLTEAVDLVAPENMESLMTSIGAHRAYFTTPQQPEGGPLVVWHNIVPCDRCDGDLMIVTDGLRVHAETWGDGSGGWTATDVERDMSQLILKCGGPCACGHRDCSDDCGNLVRVDLATEHWTTEPALVERLVEEGVDIP